MNDTTFEEGILKLHHDKKDEDYSVSLNFHRIAAELSIEDRISFARCILINLSYEDHIAMEVINRLTDKVDGWCSSTDSELRLEALVKMEDELISGYKWSWLRWLQEKIKDLGHDKRLYWMLYHDESIGLEFQRWCKSMGIESNYTDKLDADTQALADLIETAIEGLKNGKAVTE